MPYQNRKISLILCGLLTILLSACQASPQQTSSVDMAIPYSSEIGSIVWQLWVSEQLQSSDDPLPAINEAQWCQAVELRLFENSSELIPCSDRWNNLVDETLVTKK